MPNIFITNICNNNCEYCFSKNNMNNIFESHISFEKLKNIIQWSYLDPATPKNISILGGEPLLHPELDKIIKYLLAKGTKDILLFTNGLLLNEHHYLEKYPLLRFLINVNSKNDLGVHKYNILRTNIQNYPNRKQINLGLTIYPNLKNIETIQTIILENNIKNIRLGISVPDKNVNSKYDKFGYYSTMKDNYMSMLKFCLDNNIHISQDCNGIPYCLFTEKEKEYLLKKNYIEGTYSSCFNSGDIFLNGTATSCFGINDIGYIKDIFKFYNHNDFNNYLINEFVLKTTQIRENLSSFIKCKNCEFYINKMCCGGCKRFEMNDIIKTYNS